MKSPKHPAHLAVGINSQGHVQVQGYSSPDPTLKPDWEDMEDRVTELCRGTEPGSPIRVHLFTLTDLEGPKGEKKVTVVEDWPTKIEVAQNAHAIAVRRVADLETILTSAGIAYPVNPLVSKPPAVDGYVLFDGGEPFLTSTRLVDILAEAEEAALNKFNWYWGQRMESIDLDDPRAVHQLTTDVDLRLYQCGGTCEQVPLPVVDWAVQWLEGKKEVKKAEELRAKDRAIVQATRMGVIAMAINGSASEHGWRATWPPHLSVAEKMISLDEIDAPTPAEALIKWWEVYSR